MMMESRAGQSGPTSVARHDARGVTAMIYREFAEDLHPSKMFLEYLPRQNALCLLLVLYRYIIVVAHPSPQLFS